jgi:hypothetical protein
MNNLNIEELGSDDEYLFDEQGYDDEYLFDKQGFENEDKMNKNIRLKIKQILQNQVNEVGNGNSPNSSLGGGCLKCVLNPQTGGCMYCPLGRPCRNCPYRNNKNVGGKFDIVKGITGLFPNKEFHLRDQGNDGKMKKASFCGPGTQLKKRLINFNPETGEHTGIQPWSMPINELDEGCYKHDVAYTNKNIDVRHKADKELVAHADKVINNPNSTKTQRFNARLVKKIIQFKLMLGVGELFDELEDDFYEEFN